MRRALQLHISTQGTGQCPGTHTRPPEARLHPHPKQPTSPASATSGLPYFTLQGVFKCSLASACVHMRVGTCMWAHVLGGVGALTHK